MNPETIITYFAGVVTVASIISAFLPVPKKTSRWYKVTKLIEILALNIVKAKK